MTQACVTPLPTGFIRSAFEFELREAGMTEMILTNARLVLRDEVLEGTLVVRDGMIAEVQPGRSAAAGRRCRARGRGPGGSNSIRYPKDWDFLSIKL